MGDARAHRGSTNGVLKRLFARESAYLPTIFKAQLAFLVGLMLMAFVLPLSGPEEWRTVVVAAGVLAGLTWAVLDHVRRT